MNIVDIAQILALNSVEDIKDMHHVKLENELKDPNSMQTIPLKLFNTSSRQKETVIPLKGNHIQMYTCGPTVYNYAHIGNFRTYIFEDVLRRTIKFFGFTITQVMNLTDVDDKTIKGAIAKGVTLDEFTKPYTDAFFQDLKTLNIEPAEFYPAATHYIPQMIKMIEQLIDNGVAYRGQDGSIYFAISKFSRYGCLSHFHLDDLQVGASERVASDEYDKENVADFVLWKSYDQARDGNIFWESPFGPGRPGWHLECSAMAMNLLGETIDIHCGGIDNMFPHHENEIAQSEACSGHHFVNIWMHAEHLVVDNKKMSKSLGNFYTLRDLLHQGFTGLQVRYLLLQTHYKTQLNFTFQGLESAKNSLNRLNDFIQRLQYIDTPTEGTLSKNLCEIALNRFTQAMADDLNISVGLAAIFDFVREINALCDQSAIGKKEAQDVLDVMNRFNAVLGVLNVEKCDEVIPQHLQQALQQRNEARQQKNWKLSDELRDYIHNYGYIIEDTPKGIRLKKA